MSHVPSSQAAPVQSATLLGISDNEWRGMEELPACCAGNRKQMSADIDETVHGGKKVADWLSGKGAFTAHAGHSHQSGALTTPTPAPADVSGPSAGRLPWLQRLPRLQASPTMTALTLWSAVPGFVFGLQNASQARIVGDLLGKLDAGIAHRLRAPLPVPEARKNLLAYQDTVAHSRSMQRFVHWFAGRLASASSLMVMATLFVPALEPIALGTLAGYCASFAVRYSVWDRPRLTEIAPLGAQAGASLAEAGHTAAHAVRQGRKTLFTVTSAFFALYAAGAGLLMAATATPSLALSMTGMVALFVGMVSVTYLNNFPIKDTFGKNRDRYLNREQLGGTDDIYRAIGLRLAQGAALERFDAALSAIDVGRAYRWQARGLAVCEGVIVAATLCTFGLVPGPLHAFQHASRTRAMRHLLPHAGPALGALHRDLSALAQQERDEALHGATAMERAHAGLPQTQAPSSSPAPSLSDHVAALMTLMAEDLSELEGHSRHEAHVCADTACHGHATADATRMARAGHVLGSLWSRRPGAAVRGHAHVNGRLAPDHRHDHYHDPAPVRQARAEREPLVVLHALRFGLQAEKSYQVGALIDHIHARSRLAGSA